MKRTWSIVFAALLFAGGCGKRHEAPSELTFHREPTDTTGLAHGDPLLNRIEPSREPNGTLRIRGDVNFPDGVRIQISLYPGQTQQLISRVQVLVDRHHFETPPIIGASGPLPPGPYRFEYLALFNDAWQTPEVMSRINGGRDLRGPGITRDRMGAAAFHLVEERSL